MSNDLFDHAKHERLKSEAPLAARMHSRQAQVGEIHRAKPHHHRSLQKTISHGKATQIRKPALRQQKLF